MKKASGFFRFFKIFLFVILISSSFNSCEKAKSTLEGIKINIDWDVIWSKLNINFKDANTGELIGGDNFQQVSIQISGESKDAIVDISGIQKEFYKSNNGFLTLGLNPNIDAGGLLSNPARFNIIAQAAGYMPMSQNLTIAEQGTYNVTIFMASIEDPPEGVSIHIVEHIGNVIDGVLQEELIVNTSGQEASILLPQGLIMVDEAGEKLEGSLAIRLAYYNNKDDGALATFPGGLISRVEKYGDVIDGTFFPAGLVSIEIFDQHGNKAKYFEQQALQLTMTLPAGTYNPETQEDVKAGDQIPVQSYNPESGIWKYHQTTNVSVNKRNVFEVSASIPHLSWWSFDWFEGSFCNTGIELVFKGDFGECDCITLDGIIRKKADDTFLRFISLNICEDSSVHVTNAPTGVPVYIDWLLSENCSDCFTDPAFNPLNIDDLCANNTYEIPLVCFKPNSTSVTIDVTGYCANNPDLVVRPSFGTWFRPLGNFCWRYSAMQNGYSSICDVEIGQTYIVGTYYDNVWYEWQITIEKDKEYPLQLNLTNAICDEFF